MMSILKVLCSHGANLGQVDYQGDSAIYWAARQGHTAVIQYLVEQGVHVNQQNKVLFALHKPEEQQNVGNIADL